MKGQQHLMLPQEIQQVFKLVIRREISKMYPLVMVDDFFCGCCTGWVKRVRLISLFIIMCEDLHKVISSYTSQVTFIKYEYSLNYSEWFIYFIILLNYLNDGDWWSIYSIWISPLASSSKPLVSNSSKLNPMLSLGNE